MSTRKTIRVPLGADGVPVVVDRQNLDRTNEIPADASDAANLDGNTYATQAAPCEAVNDEVTVPVHSSIESSLTFEVLRRQSTEDGSENSSENGSENSSDEEQKP